MISKENYNKALNLNFAEYYHDIEDQTPYIHPRFVPNVHVGQRKLLISEVNFLNFTLDDAREKKIIVYVGAAEGWHIGMLLRLYPGIRMILIDPSNFNIRITTSRSITHRNFPKLYVNMKTSMDLAEQLADMDKRLIIYQEYMTDELTTKIANTLSSLDLLDDVLFVSDIRTADERNNVRDEDILKNQEDQMRWRKILGEPASLLKTRCKFYRKDLRNPTTPIPNVYLYLQPWSGARSTETRAFLPPGPVEMIDISDKEYEEKMNLFNMMRGLKPVKPNITLTPNLIRIGFCQSWDCAREVDIWQHYLDKPGAVDTDVESLIDTALIFTAKGDNMSLINHGGGELFGEMSYSLYESLYRKHVSNKERLRRQAYEKQSKIEEYQETTQKQQRQDIRRQQSSQRQEEHRKRQGSQRTRGGDRQRPTTRGRGKSNIRRGNPNVRHGQLQTARTNIIGGRNISSTRGGDPRTTSRR